MDLSIGASRAWSCDGSGTPREKKDRYAHDRLVDRRLAPDPRHRRQARLRAHVLHAPPGSSAGEFLDTRVKEAQPGEIVRGGLNRAFFGLHQWRNAGLVLGLPMPGFEDLEPRVDGAGPHVPDAKTRKNPGAPIRTLDISRPRAVAIDKAFGGRSAPPLADYVKALLTAREASLR